jgi:periplasmic protein TonB
MTAFAVGARSGDPERARFIRALIASLLLHALFLALKSGPAPGVLATSQPGGGTIEAVLRRAPAAATPEQPTFEAGVEAAMAAATAEAFRIREAAEAPSRPTSIPPPAPAVATPAAPGAREEGRDAAPGAATSGGDSQAIPLLPPLAGGMQHLPRPASLMAPLNFSYPPNVRVQEGRVRVRILLDDKGRIEEMRAVAASPPGFFDHAAVQVLRSGRFAPGFIGAIPVRSYLFMEVSFGPGSQGQQVWYVGSSLAPPSYRTAASF